jgi:hypothetical protein
MNRIGNMTIRKLFFSIFLILSFIILYFTFFSSSEKKKSNKLSKEQLSLLLGGGGSSEKSYNSGRGQRKTATNSIFDEGDFMKVGVSNSYEEEVAAKEEGEIPINPQTGKPYDEETMEQFEQLRTIFPGNDLIPKKITQADKLEKEKSNKELSRIALAMSSSSATREDISFYYETQEKVIKDRIEIIEYLVDIEKEEGPLTTDQNIEFDKILAGTKEQMTNLQNQKEQALAKAK